MQRQLHRRYPAIHYLSRDTRSPAPGQCLTSSPSRRKVWIAPKSKPYRRGRRDSSSPLASRRSPLLSASPRKVFPPPSYPAASTWLSGIQVGRPRSAAPSFSPSSEPRSRCPSPREIRLEGALPDGVSRGSSTPRQNQAITELQGGLMTPRPRGCRRLDARYPVGKTGWGLALSSRGVARGSGGEKRWATGRVDGAGHKKVWGVAR